MEEIIKIAREALASMLKEDEVELIFVSQSGSSGARVTIFRHSRTNSLYAVKCVNQSRISLREEIRKKEILSTYFSEHLPNILWYQKINNFEVIISECKGINTLHDLIINSYFPNSQLLNLWKDVIKKLVDTWKHSKHPFKEFLCPRFFPERIKRIEKGLREIIIKNIKLSDYWNIPFIINEKKYLSLKESIKVISEVGKPEFGVVCHGDPQPSNIIITPNKKWYFVDWEWSGPHQDWRMMVSHLFGWWSTRCLVLETQPKIKIKKNWIEIFYKAFVPDYLRPYQNLAKLAVKETCENKVDNNTICDINRFLATLYLGELRFLKIWKREKFKIPLLAQGIITATELGKEKNDFQFSFNVGIK